nr:MAG TPA: hypothetical protein [Caudoviricetes sp.]
MKPKANQIQNNTDSAARVPLSASRLSAGGDYPAEYKNSP